MASEHSAIVAWLQAPGPRAITPHGIDELRHAVDTSSTARTVTRLRGSMAALVRHALLTPSGVREPWHLEF